ncbi:F420-dependent methylene-tetrahydromethanopterin reductase [Rhodococcoides fascians]|uniref:LLM class flavin-dependent oxidoreductase n=1 Tax=Rhodococcoides fascians TaxID=1828 RepID=UPI000B9A6C5F|nr:LLM class flavin-dependent oxidoreductase [Rhodococcus fascians]OZE88519.1 F420-dependent methylene-tetrahydromethanopterin reductase [Rhodococcus fascians]OZF16480.1 F420-dependent methylene-tetrahydromethanopterin reductase [Rhodococcus fascians]OZF19497.1 F420-dependent methylene-tetrahydromethanopterin reductase [Rhodococcus fascians]OZF65761.1 F420-dependent methylene-tetrahydromethanopterin reductase [Rhodococcus fascians]OZF68913.1 F420-dependent methylene-tetrahydromethanopterin red
MGIIDHHPDTGAPFDQNAQIHLGVFYPGIGAQTVWEDPNAPDQVATDTFVEVAGTLERGLFDAFFLGDGQRIRENRGDILSTDIAGRPDAITQLAALASVTERIGLVATQNTTYSIPVELARRLATLDALSDGRAGWNIVTTDNAWTGENFRRGGWLEHERRYERATQVVELAKQYWAGSPVEFHTDLLETVAAPNVRSSVQGRPVLFQAGDSPGGRDLAARHADVVFSANNAYDAAVAYAKDLRARTVAYGRPADAVKILPGVTVVLGDTEAEAEEKVRWLRSNAHNGVRAIAFLEHYWGKDLSAYDPEGPLPDIDPVDAELDPSRGTLSIDARTGKLTQIAQWRALSEQKGLSIRELVLEVSPASRFHSGTPAAVADHWADLVRHRVVDGFNINPYHLRDAIGDLVDKLVPALQERGVFRTEYTSTTLRGHLGLDGDAASDRARAS